MIAVRGYQVQCDPVVHLLEHREGGHTSYAFSGAPPPEELSVVLFKLVQKCFTDKLLVSSLIFIFRLYPRFDAKSAKALPLFAKSNQLLAHGRLLLFVHSALDKETHKITLSVLRLDFPWQCHLAC